MALCISVLIKFVMKPRLAISLILGALLVVACATHTSRIPSLSNIAHIHITARPGWSLSILPDGSGEIGYGSNAFDFASIPAGTFDFEQVYSALAATVSPDGNVREWFSVAFHEKDNAETYSQYTREADLVLGLFKTAKEKCGPLDKTRMDDLGKQKPPSSGR